MNINSINKKENYLDKKIILIELLRNIEIFSIRIYLTQGKIGFKA